MALWLGYDFVSTDFLRTHELSVIYRQQGVAMPKELKNPEAMNLGRRKFLTAAGSAGAGMFLAPTATAAQGAVGQHGATTPWKLDVTIYDRPGWTSTSYGLPLTRLPNGNLGIGFQAQREDGLTDDFYSVHAHWVFLDSANDGRSWRQVSIESMPVDPRWRDRSAHCTYGWPLSLSGGTLVNVVGEDPTPEQHKEHLERVGLGHLWFEDSTFGWDLWPESYTQRLRAQGLYVFDSPGPHLPTGIVATHNRPLVSTISRDGGKTWVQKRIEGLPKFARCTGWFRGGVALRDGTALGGFYAVVRKDEQTAVRGVYAMRSHDRGETWHMSPIVEDPDNKRSYSEVNMMELADGRVLALIRGNGDAYLYRSYTEDQGQTWSPPKPTPIPGSPANMIRLSSGKILCVYRHIGYPAGYRGVLSADDGMSWDVEKIIRIRDDTLPGLIGYPSSLQLDDGTIFTLYNVLRVGPLQEADHWQYKRPLRVDPPLHSYIAGSIYTEDYTEPLGHTS